MTPFPLWQTPRRPNHRHTSPPAPSATVALCLHLHVLEGPSRCLYSLSTIGRLGPNRRRIHARRRLQRMGWARSGFDESSLSLLGATAAVHAETEMDRCAEPREA